MEKKNIDWSNIGFGYMETDKRFVSNYKNGAWDDGVLTDDANVVINECAGVRTVSPGSECQQNGRFRKETDDAGISGR